LSIGEFNQIASPAFGGIAMTTFEIVSFQYNSKPEFATLGLTKASAAIAVSRIR